MCVLQSAAAMLAFVTVYERTSGTPIWLYTMPNAVLPGKYLNRPLFENKIFLPAPPWHMQRLCTPLHCVIQQQASLPFALAQPRVQG